MEDKLFAAVTGRSKGINLSGLQVLWQRLKTLEQCQMIHRMRHWEINYTDQVTENFLKK